MVRKTNYQFTAVPTQLFLCMDNNCRCTLFSLIQLSTFYESKNGTAFDGWFFRTNALLEEETNLSKNVLSGALDALYQAGIIDVIPQEKGKGKAQGARKYRVNYETFLKYQSIPFEECSCSHPDFGIVTSDYKKGVPSFQHRHQLEEQPKCGKSDNNIDIIDNSESLDIIDIETINNIDNSIINNRLDISSHLEVDLKSEIEVETEKEEEPHSNNQGDDAILGDTSTFVDYPEAASVQTHEDSNLPSPAITADFIDSQIPFIYSKVNRQGETQKLDNYTDAAYDILDEYGREVKNWIGCIQANGRYKSEAAARLLEVINGHEYQSQGECEKTALDLMEYAAKCDAQYSNEIRSRIYN